MLKKMLDPMYKIQSSRKILATAMTFKRPIYSFIFSAFCLYHHLYACIYLSMCNVNDQNRNMHSDNIKMCSWQYGNGLRGWRYWSPFDSKELATNCFFCFFLALDLKKEENDHKRSHKHIRSNYVKNDEEMLKQAKNRKWLEMKWVFEMM